MATPESPIRVLAVDDHPVLLDGLGLMIDSQPDMRLVARATSGSEGAQLFREHLPDVTLVDLRLPDMHGIWLIQTLRNQSPIARIIVLTTYLGDMQALKALRAGAQGYLLKATLRLDLVDAIRTVHAGGRRIPPEVAAALAEHATDDTLTEREIQVLQGVASGHSNKLIAESLKIREDTVKTHMRSILAKLGANDRTHAVMIALKRGFLEL